MGFILSIDQGTTGTTAVLINDSNFMFVDKVNKEFPQIFPQPGWVEHDLNDIWATVQSTISAVLKKNNLKVVIFLPLVSLTKEKPLVHFLKMEFH